MLRARIQRAELLPTGRGWALLRNLGPHAMESTREDAEQNREVVMAGNLGASSIALIDIIGFLASGMQTGLLSSLSGDFERTIFLNRGDVVGANSNVPEEQLGEFLVRRGKITRAQLAEALRTSRSEVSRACVDNGFVAAHDLYAMVQAQHTEIFDKLLATESGLWTFSRVSENTLSGSQVHLPTQRLLMDALRKVDEMRLYREVIRSAECVVQRLPPPEEGDDIRPRKLREDVATQALALNEQITSTSTILHLMRKSGRSEFDVTRLVFHLHRAKLIEVLAAESTTIRRPPASSISTSDTADVVVIYSMAMREMFDELARKGQADVLHDAARGFLDDPAAPHSPLLRSIQLDRDGAINEDSMQVALQVSGFSLSEMSEALDELLFFLLFQATEVVGRRRRDDLARRVKMIHGMLSASAR